MPGLQEHNHHWHCLQAHAGAENRLTMALGRRPRAWSSAGQQLSVRRLCAPQPLRSPLSACCPGAAPGGSHPAHGVRVCSVLERDTRLLLCPKHDENQLGSGSAHYRLNCTAHPARACRSWTLNPSGTGAPTPSSWGPSPQALLSAKVSIQQCSHCPTATDTQAQTAAAVKAVCDGASALLNLIAQQPKADLQSIQVSCGALAALPADDSPLYGSHDYRQTARLQCPSWPAPCRLCRQLRPQHRYWSPASSQCSSGSHS